MYWVKKTNRIGQYKCNDCVHGITTRTICFYGAMLFLVAVGMPGGAHAISLEQAARQAVETNPVIDESSANKRAVKQELNQAFGTFLPTLDLSGEIGRQWVNRPESLDPIDNKKWRTDRQITATANQVLFKGFERLNELYRQAARVDGAAFRVLERSEFIALKTSEVFIELNRLAKFEWISSANVDKHEEILSLVQRRKDGGKASASEVFQVQERTELARSILARIHQEKAEARAQFRKLVGQPAGGLLPARLPNGLPRNLDQATNLARGRNSALQVADADVDSAHYEYQKSHSAFMPTVGVQARAQHGDEISGTPGRNDEKSVMLRMSWNLFNGGIDRARRAELMERLGEAESGRDIKRRDIDEAVEQAWAAYIKTGARIRALNGRADASEKLVGSYFEEYELARRSLLDLLDAQNSLFNAEIELSNVVNIRKVAAYRLLAATGQILDALHIERPDDSYSDARARLIRSKHN